MKQVLLDPQSRVASHRLNHTLARHSICGSSVIYNSVVLPLFFLGEGCKKGYRSSTSQFPGQFGRTENCGRSWKSTGIPEKTGVVNVPPRRAANTAGVEEIDACIEQVGTLNKERSSFSKKSLVGR